VLLHGVGTDEHDLEGLAPSLDGRFLVRSLRAPYPMGPGANAWFNFSITADGRRLIDAAQAETSRKRLIGELDAIVAEEGCDPERVYVAGFSQGAILTLSLALTVPGKLAGGVVMSGRLVPDVEPLMAQAGQLQGLPLLVVHGTEDAVLPIENGRAVKSRLEKLPVKLEYREFPMPHTISRESLALVSSWLTARLDSPRR
jgi:phospholipase/carboxylesterase